MTRNIPNPMRLAFVLSDFYLHPEEQGEPAPAVASLANALRHASGERLAGDWRAWLAQRHFPASYRAAQAQPAQSSLAREFWLSHICPVATAATAPAACWFATPVHCRAGLSHVQLDARGCLRLNTAEVTELLAAFGRDFAGNGWSLADAGDGRLLLAASDPVAAVITQPPERWLGCNVAAAQPLGPGAARLRAITGEIELWLFSAEVNRRRVQSGLPAVTQLWLWDSVCDPGCFAARPPDSHDRPRLYGRDAVAAALVQAQAGVTADLPSQCRDLLDMQVAGLTVALLPTQEPGGQDLAGFLEQWLAPSLQATQQGALRSLQLLANGHIFTLRPRHAWRFWRRRRPWHQVLGA
jgi:hypothetical protein